MLTTASLAQRDPPPVPAEVDVPLVVDLDGTLTPTDTLAESALALLRRNPLYLFALAWWLLHGRAVLKTRLAERSLPHVAALPWREDLLSLLREHKAAGRRIVLATAAHRDIADAVASHLRLFDDVIATSAASNVKGAAKLEAIRRCVDGPFDYAGDARADLAVWQGARSAWLVGVSEGVARAVPVPVAYRLPRVEAGVAVWAKALRVHQWVKNLLILVPLLTASAYRDLSLVTVSLGAFLAFSLAASATYVMNDLWDLDSDRLHPRKRERPFASGRLPIVYGVSAAAGLMTTAAALAWAVAPAFFAMLAGYVVITTAYSWTLKRYVVLDVVTLAMLYTWRVIAGGVALDIRLTAWLLAFSVFAFTSLALVKRCAELVSLKQAGRTAAHGRDYRVDDLVVLWPLGVGASLCSVVVFGLYIGSPGAATLYARSELLWLVGVGLMYWTARLWIKTARGEMHDDPIVFALRDRGSRLAVLSMVALTVAAHLLA